MSGGSLDTLHETLMPATEGRSKYENVTRRLAAGEGVAAVAAVHPSEVAAGVVVAVLQHLEASSSIGHPPAAGSCWTGAPRQAWRRALRRVLRSPARTANKRFNGLTGIMKHSLDCCLLDLTLFNPRSGMATASFLPGSGTPEWPTTTFG